MKRIRFTGLVRLAHEVQQELSSPISTARREQLRRHVQHTLRMVEQTLVIRGAKFGAVPGPSRRAFQFLRTLDFDRVATTSLEESAEVTGPVTLRGITVVVEQLSERLADQVDENRSDLLGVPETISRLLTDLESGSKPLDEVDLTARSREHLAWLRFFACPERLASCVQAIRRASRVFGATAPHDRWPRPMHPHFRPTQSIYRVRAMLDFTRVLLPTPMICLEEGEFELLGRAMFGRRSHRREAALHELLLSDKYQSLQAELRKLAGVVEQTRGMVHDLADAFDRVNHSMFDGGMPRPWLRWNRCITAGKFGHYNYATDTVMISRALDRPGIPSFVIDHVMHHELLHKKYGLRWDRGRGHSHTPEFRCEERKFPFFEAADQFLRKLSWRDMGETA